MSLARISFRCNRDVFDARVKFISIGLAGRVIVAAYFYSRTDSAVQLNVIHAARRTIGVVQLISAAIPGNEGMTEFFLRERYRVLNAGKARRYETAECIAC